MKKLIYLIAGCLSCLAANAKTPPNFLLILTDDQGWSQLSAKMHPGVEDSYSSYLHTPNMNRVGDNGMRFTSGYSPAPLCTPKRRSILCGTSAARSGTEFASPKWIPAEHMTMPKALKLANPDYQCAHFGKWGEQMNNTPEECGYDVSDGLTGNKTGGMEDKMKPHHINEDPKRTGSVTKRAVDFMSKQVKARKPFYAQVSYYAVHLRVELEEASLKKYQEKGEPDRAHTHGWAGMLEEMDAGVGRLLDTLAELDVAKNTYVVFTTDNGGRGIVPGGNGKSAPPNAPLSGAKHSLLEGGIRVPFMVSGPGIQPGSVCHTPVCGYDFLPTFYSLAEGKAGLGEEIDGGDFSGLFANPESGCVKRPMDALIFHRPRQGASAIRQGDYKLYLKGKGDGRTRLLTNAREDHAEKDNLAEKHPEIADKLEELLTGFTSQFKHMEPPAKKPKRNKKKK